MKLKLNKPAIVAVALVGLAFPLIASAQCRRVVVSGTIAAMATQTETAFCSATEQAVGGGFSLASNSLIIHASQPTASLDGWAGVIENTDGTPHGFDVIAICAEAATCTRVVTSGAIAASATQTETASCASGTAVGGGFSLASNGLIIHASQPTASLDGWEGVIENTDGSPHGFDVVGVCCSGTCTRVITSGAIAGNATQTETASCTSGIAVGGGFSLASNGLTIHSTQSTSPLADWVGVIENTDGTPHGFDVIGVCCVAPLPAELQSFSVEENHRDEE